MFLSPAGGRLIFDSAGFPLDVVPQADRRLRKLVWGVVLSIALHSLLLWWSPLRPPDPTSAANSPLEVSLLPRSDAPPRVEPTTNEPITPPRSPVRNRPLMTAPRRSSQPALPAQPPPEPEVRREPVVESPTDFSSMLEARRAERRRIDDAIAEANAQFRAAGSDASGEERAAAAARRNLAALGNQQGGTGGVFSIVEKGHRYARYAFNGWMPSRTNGWREVIEVDAGPQGDVNRAIIRSMIALIRKHYQGNFNWESHRLGRVVVLSARMEDNQGLEDFMMREFF